MHLLSDQKRGVVTSCKCVGWGGADYQLAEVSPDRIQRSPPWTLHHWMSLLVSDCRETKAFITKTNNTCCCNVLGLSLVKKRKLSINSCYHLR